MTNEKINLLLSLKSENFPSINIIFLINTFTFHKNNDSNTDCENSYAVKVLFSYT